MAVDEEAPEGGEGGKKEKPAGGSPLVKIISYVALALVLMAVSAYVAASVAKKEGAPPADTANSSHTSPDDVGQARTAPLRILPAGEIITQIRGKSLKMTIELAFDAEKHKTLETELTNRKPQLLDMFHQIVFTAPPTDLAPENLSGLKVKMLTQVNDVLKDGQITAVYITGYIYTG